MGPIYTPPDEPPPQGVVSSLIQSYIDFEINNHESADALRKLLFGFFIGTLVAGWILLGIFVGAIPIGWMFAGNTESDKSRLNLRKAPEETDDNNALADLTNRVTLALDSNWLKELENRVKKNSGMITTFANCCVLPNNSKKGSVECELVRNAPKNTTFLECVSNLVYKFQFGPAEEKLGNKG